MKTFKVIGPTDYEHDAVRMEDTPKRPTAVIDPVIPRFVNDWPNNIWVNKSTDPTKPDWGHASQTHWQTEGYKFFHNDDKTIQELVTEYLTVNRSRHRYFEELGGDFFNPKLNESFYVEKLEELLYGPDICPEGAKRFLDWLPDRWSDKINYSRSGKQVNISLVVTVDEPYDGHRNDDGLTYDIVNLITDYATELNHNIQNVEFTHYDVEEVEID